MRSTCCLAVATLSFILALAGCSFDKAVSPVDFYGPPPPNPLNLKVSHQMQPYPEADIVFSTPEAGWVRLEILNATGYKVKMLLDGKVEAGTITVQWDGTNEDGENVNSGLFIYDLRAASFRSWKIMLWCTDADCGGMIKDGEPND